MEIEPTLCLPFIILNHTCQLKFSGSANSALNASVSGVTLLSHIFQSVNDNVLAFFVFQVDFFPVDLF